MLEDFKGAIESRSKVQIDFVTKDGELKTRLCIPFDFGPSRRNLNPNPELYHFFDLNSPDGQHNLSLEPRAIRSMKVTDETFDPGDYVKWKPNWFLPRNWDEWS